jgi:hypothetical protein
MNRSQSHLFSRTFLAVIEIGSSLTATRRVQASVFAVILSDVV